MNQAEEEKQELREKSGLVVGYEEVEENRQQEGYRQKMEQSAEVVGEMVRYGQEAQLQDLGLKRVLRQGLGQELQ